MSWQKIPNEVVRLYTGLPKRMQRLDSNLEGLFKPFGCPAVDCKETFEVFSTASEHARANHELPPDTSFKAEPIMEDASTARVLMGLLMAFGDDRRDNLLASIRKPNDSYHAGETWRRVYLAMTRNEGEIRLKKAQYDWLQALLDRMLPLPKDKREMGEEQMNVAQAMYGLSEDNARQAFKTLDERRIPEREPDEEPVAVGA